MTDRLRWLPPLVTAVVLVALVELLVATGVFSESSLPLPTDVASSWWSQVGEGDYWTAIRRSMSGWAIGLAIATVLAIPLGALAGASASVFRSLQFVVDFLRPIPPVALLPLLILVLGVSDNVKITMAAIGAFFPLFFATLYGIHDLDPVTGETARVYGMNRRQRFVFVVLPGATPYIATGMRVSATIALLLVVGTEMVVGIPGLGRSIVDAQYAGDLPGMYARVVTAGVLGVLITALFRRAERRVLHWHPSQQGASA